MVKHTRTLPCWALAACLSPAPEPTLVDTLRTVAVEVEPPELAAGESLEFKMLVADPEDLSPDLAVWLCTPSGDTCLEESTLPLSTISVTQGPLEGGFSGVLTLPEHLDSLLDDTDQVALSLWALACAPGECDVIERLRTAPPPGTAAHGRVLSQMADPASWLGDLPMERASLAHRPVMLSRRSPDERNLNPNLEDGPPAQFSVDRGATYGLVFAVTDDLYEFPRSRGLTTSGRFSDEWYDVSIEGTTLEFQAPDQSGTAELYVTVRDGLGGLRTWTGRADIR